MRISDWSSDVCSSDLAVAVARNEGIAVDEEFRLDDIEVDEVFAPGEEVGRLQRQPVVVLEDILDVDAGAELEGLRALRVEVRVRHEAVDHAGADRDLEVSSGQIELVHVRRAEGMAVAGEPQDRKSVVWGKRVSVSVVYGGRRR